MYGLVYTCTFWCGFFAGIFVTVQKISRKENNAKKLGKAILSTGLNLILRGMNMGPKTKTQVLIDLKSAALEALALFGRWKTRDIGKLERAIWASYDFAVFAGTFLTKKPPTKHTNYPDYELLKQTIAAKERAISALFIGVWLDMVNIEKAGTDLQPLIDARTAALQFVRLGKDLLSLWKMHLNSFDDASIEFTEVNDLLRDGRIWAAKMMMTAFRHEFPLDDRYFLLLRNISKAEQAARIREILSKRLGRAINAKQWTKVFHNLSILRPFFSESQFLREQQDVQYRLEEAANAIDVWFLENSNFVSITPAVLDGYSAKVTAYQDGKKRIPCWESNEKTNFLFIRDNPLWIVVTYTNTVDELPEIVVPYSQRWPKAHSTITMAAEISEGLKSFIFDCLEKGWIGKAKSTLEEITMYYPGDSELTWFAERILKAEIIFNTLSGGIAAAVVEEDFMTAKSMVTEMGKRFPGIDLTRMKKLIAQGFTAKRQLDRAVERATPYLRENRLCHKLTALAYRALARKSYREAEYALNLIAKINPIFYSIETLATKMAQAIDADALVGAILVAAETNQVAAANLALHDLEQKFPTDSRVRLLWKKMYRVMSKSNQKNRIEMILMHRLYRAKKDNEWAQVGKNLAKMNTFNPQSALLVTLTGEIREHFMDIVEETINVYQDGTGFISITPVVLQGYLPAVVHAFQNDVALQPTWDKGGMTNFRYNPSMALCVMVDYSSKVDLPFFSHLITITAVAAVSEQAADTVGEAATA
jgi:hypothetical protein